MLSNEDNLGFEIGGTPRPPLKGVTRRIKTYEEWPRHAEQRR